MKYDSFFVKVNIILLFAALILASCEEKLKIEVSPKTVEFDANPAEAKTVNISANVEWEVVIEQEEEWLTIDPAQGKGNATITITASDNAVFTDREAFIIISGEGVDNAKVRVLQLRSLDVAEYIEDPKFKQYCLAKFDNDPQDGKISLKEAKIVKVIDIKDNMEIKSLAGIEYFSNITTLNCSGNNLKSFDLSKNTELRKLDCSYNPIEHIDVSVLARLTDLVIFDAGLTKIDVSENTALQWLAVSNNKIASIDLSNNKNLLGFECNNNKFTSLDISKNAELMNLYCGGNQLKELDVSKNMNLVHLYCSNNKQLDRINTSQNAKLETFSCTHNKIATLDLDNNKNLTQLQCDSTQITKLILKENTELRVLSCYGKLTESIDLSNNTLLQILKLRNNDALKYIYVWEGCDTLNRYYEKGSNTFYRIK